MATTDIIPATEDHVREIAKLVRPEDRDELWATAFCTPEQAMSEGLAMSEKAFTGLIDGVPVCMWGVVRPSFLFDVGTPWMVGTVDLDRHAMKFLRRCRRPLLALFEGYDKLENYVDARNVRSIEWLRFMGFTVEEKAEEYGVLKIPFHRFWKERQSCATRQ